MTSMCNNVLIPDQKKFCSLQTKYTKIKKEIEIEKEIEILTLIMLDKEYYFCTK